MVKNRELIEFSATQNMALAMLGYYRWLPREIITAHSKAQNPIPTPPLTPARPSSPPPEKIIPSPAVAAEPPPVVMTTETAKPFLVPLGESGATLNISRDYAILRGEKLPCIFLLPPLWANEKGLHCFATPAEKMLWLNAWKALNIPVVEASFSALFAAEIPFQTVPETPLGQTLEQENKPIVCVGTLLGLDIPAHYLRFDLTHPWFLLQKPLTKKTFWLQLLALKEKLF